MRNQAFIRKKSFSKHKKFFKIKWTKIQCLPTTKMNHPHDCTNWGCMWLDGQWFFVGFHSCANHTCQNSLIFFLHIIFSWKFFFEFFFQIQPHPPTYYLRTNTPITLAYFLTICLLLLTCQPNYLKDQPRLWYYWQLMRVLYHTWG